MSRKGQYGRFLNIARRVEASGSNKRLKLPVELIEIVLLQLSATDVVKCQTVSKDFRRIILGSAALQYKIRCFLADVVDGPSSKWTVAQRASGLRKWVDGWRKAPLSADKSLELPQIEPWDIMLGYNTLGYQPKSGRHEIVFVQLASPSRGVQQKQWHTRIKLHGEIDDWTFDDTQDLLLVHEMPNDGTICVHLLTISNGNPHPLALRPRLSLKLASRLTAATFSYYIHISSRLLVFCVCDDVEDVSSQCWVFDWIKGTELMVLEGPQVHATKILDDRHVIVPVPSGIPCEWALAVFDVATVPLSPHIHDEALVLFILPRFTSKAPEPDPNIGIGVQLFMDGVSESSCPSPALDSLPFYPAGDSRFIYLLITAGDAQGLEESHAIVIPAATFQSRLLAVNKSLGLVSRAPWRSWGSETRYLGPSFHASFQCASNSRILFETKHGEECTLNVLEFSSLPSLTHDLTFDPPSDAAATIVFEPTRIRSIWLDESEEIETMVPYRKIATNITYPAGGTHTPYIGDQCIVVRSETDSR
ncbi:hypothetical protein PHLGIDRAFT_229502 [Phlebiopsis gigantea 11061_1 CR5-6]|uniref:F-box domain-containing protein n=1 Tax=Phlebiopsis gigantea (strain 11061_1 CR5-6) TaxID=745531 RepID=A0A0C3RSZ7_PHLG1|nr:hypothetical protein PHLGIDRAFT_229502 [Phlebiopsis gigantea 11061_1 CR5-6]